MSLIQKHRKAGISFVIRCRNEENYIGKCIASLKNLKIKHEIIVVLHLCTDKSKSIVESLKNQGYPIKIFDYTQEVSRAGYETLITPANHTASLMVYYNFCFSKATYNWIMKWDADFKCSKQLNDYLNSDLKLGDSQPTCIRIDCQLGKNGPKNSELYLTNALEGFTKHVFWEVPYYTKDYQEIRLQNAPILSIPVKILKNYWKQPPWFMSKVHPDKDLVNKYKKAIELLGPEPPGMARANNEQCDDIYRAVIVKQDILKSYGIDPFT